MSARAMKDATLERCECGCGRRTRRRVRLVREQWRGSCEALRWSCGVAAYEEWVPALRGHEDDACAAGGYFDALTEGESSWQTT